MKQLLATLLIVLAIGCTKSNPTAPVDPIIPIPFSIIGVSFSTPESNQHDTSLSFCTRWALRGVPDSIQYQTEFLDSLINDRQSFYFQPYPYSADSLIVTARADYWINGVEYWYSYTETVAVVKINRQKEGL